MGGDDLLVTAQGGDSLDRTDGAAWECLPQCRERLPEDC
jgi:hypothetical protein